MGKYYKRSDSAAEARALIMLGEKLREALEVCGLPQTEIADRAGVSRSRVSQMFSGRENPSMRALARFANWLDMDVDVVFRPRVRKDEP